MTTQGFSPYLLYVDEYRQLLLASKHLFFVFPLIWYLGKVLLYFDNFWDDQKGSPNLWIKVQQQLVLLYPECYSG